MMACFDRISYVKSIYMNLPIRTKTHKKIQKNKNDKNLPTIFNIEY